MKKSVIRSKTKSEKEIIIGETKGIQTYKIVRKQFIKDQKRLINGEKYANLG